MNSTKKTSATLCSPLLRRKFSFRYAYNLHSWVWIHVKPFTCAKEFDQTVFK
ncbi:hypothetical protein HanRHA438_Chr04g0154871 [Helianthus annuus]|nr:hypothetical protein HanIR_Chr04g0155241 [Helianthus annuus]KAJ0925017.1 hypothetical protein HanRHA438_Chr04g0154871 [Helianthus annuus]